MDCVKIVEVGPRDGLQNVKKSIPTQTKIDLIARLRDTGLTNIELTSIVSPRAVPQLSDGRQLIADERIQHLLSQSDLRLPVLVPNIKGLRIALAQGVREVAVFVSASEGFSKANINCTVEESLTRASEVIREALDAHVAVRGYVSCIFSDPFDGKIPPLAVARVVRRLLDLGCYQVSLGDTLGVGTPVDVTRLLCELHAAGIPSGVLAGHFHDTYGQALANIWQAYQHGVRVFDSSVAGLGGCPYCPGATGNVATEEVVYMFSQAGISTGVDLEKLADSGDWICRELGLSNASRVGNALIFSKRRQVALDEDQDDVQKKADAQDLHSDRGSAIVRAGDLLISLWQTCRLLWHTQHQNAVPMGT